MTKVNQLEIQLVAHSSHLCHNPHHRVLSSGVAVMTNFHFCARFEKLLFRVLKNANSFSVTPMLSLRQQISPPLNEALTLFNNSSTTHCARFSPASSVAPSLSSQNSSR